MKKLLSVVLMAALLVTALAGCSAAGGKDDFKVGFIFLHEIGRAHV